MSPRPRRALALLEVLVVGVLATLIAIPLHQLIRQSGHEAMTSEDYRQAELVAERLVSEVMALDFEKLAASVPLTRPVKGVPQGDAAIAGAYPEYARFFASQGLSGEVKVSELAKGLLAIEAHLTWPVKPGSSTRRSYSLLRLRARADGGVRGDWPISKGQLLTVDEKESPPTEETP